MVVGLINGLGVAYAGVPPIIMTLGMNSAIQGLLLIYTNGGLCLGRRRLGLVDFVDGRHARELLDDAAGSGSAPSRSSRR